MKLGQAGLKALLVITLAAMSCAVQHGGSRPITETRTVEATPEQGSAEITELQAIELAKKELNAEIGSKLEDYRISGTTTSDGKRWMVLFDPKVPLRPGGGYWATVDKATGQIASGHSD